MDDVSDRLTLSRETLYRWRAMGGPSGKLEDLLRMVSEEVSTLDSLLNEHPALSGSIGLLIEGYEALHSDLKQKAH